MTIWIALNSQGPVMAYEDRAEAEAFASQFSYMRVVSCAFARKEPATAEEGMGTERRFDNL